MHKDAVPVAATRKESSSGSVSTIAVIVLIAGTADILLAFLQHYLLRGTNPLMILKFIASGLLGKDAFTGGNAMAGWGLLLHFLIVFSWTYFFFLAYPKLASFVRNRWLAAALIAVFIWVVMNLVVLPLSRTPTTSLQLEGTLLSIAILFLAVGIPISFFLHRHYHR
jgi:hypothetical protein